MSENKGTASIAANCQENRSCPGDISGRGTIGRHVWTDTGFVLSIRDLTSNQIMF